MITNLVCWLIVTLIIFPFGIATAFIFKLHSKNYRFSEIVLLGIIPVLFLSTIVGFFSRINIEFFLTCLIIAGLVLLKFRKNVFQKITETRELWFSISLQNRIILILFILTTGIQSSLPTNIPDDGLYYLQTVKWANTFGIPKDVIKYGLQYGQFSTWHIFQGTFNFSTLFGNRLNNINGWILVIFTLFIIEKSHLNSSKKARFFALIAILSILIFQYFVTAPSPDLPVFLISMVVFYYYLFQPKTLENTMFISLLSLTAILIKPTAAYLLFFALFFNWRILLSKKFILVALVAVILISTKSLTTSSSLFFPFNLQINGWGTSDGILAILEEKDKTNWDSAFGVYAEQVSTLSLFNKLFIWLFKLGYKSIFNLLWISGIILVAITYFKTKRKELFAIASISTLVFIILWNVAPSYRFSLPLIILNYCVVLLHFIKFTNIKINSIYFFLSLSGLWLTPLISIVLNLSHNNIVKINYPIEMDYLLIRAKPFKSMEYDTALLNGEVVFIPPNHHYPWDGPLPCVMRWHYEKYSKEK